MELDVAEQKRRAALEKKRAYNLLAVEQRIAAKNDAYLKHNQEIARAEKVSVRVRVTLKQDQELVRTKKAKPKH